MAKFTCYYYLTESGRSPVREFIDSLDFKSQRKFFFVKELLEEFGYKLPFPHAKYIGKDVFELRFRGHEGNVRVLYFFYHQDKAIFTNGFIKKSAKTPKKEIEIAVARKAKYLNKYRGDDTK
ncbi:MAG: type II toxin-antitoxin system RelE/ParE family toxin [Candidatus Omnitrophica bacterium]|nr:type II toxin-antitoxin system RelE/ParE family toxin [Candidatus Omnitrophota bacterium]MBU4488335.1 type II toxin-antitoxin system RelE/ParE family toxin [Candidatus Omnitrophota bacterium]MCG2704985.1 type II toxin-antitoxin system RelE/ParE family toxin [Candidatus Omnitrophota bacterium]